MCMKGVLRQQKQNNHNRLYSTLCNELFQQNFDWEGGEAMSLSDKAQTAISVVPQKYSELYTCIGTPPESLGEKPNNKLFTVDPYFWAMYYAGLSKRAKNDTWSNLFVCFLSSFVVYFAPSSNSKFAEKLSLFVCLPSSFFLVLLLQPIPNLLIVFLHPSHIGLRLLNRLNKRRLTNNTKKKKQWKPNWEIAWATTRSELPSSDLCAASKAFSWGEKCV